VVGGYYADAKYENHSQTDNRTSSFVGSKSDYKAGTESRAVFADGTLRVADPIRLLGGIRYTREKKFVNGEAGSTLPGATRTRLDVSRSEGAVSYRAGAEWDAGPASLVYATVSTGFHSGGFYFTANDPEFAPEKMTAYTIGAKNRFLGNRLQVNVELFHWDFTDQQLTYLARDLSGSTSTAVINAGQTRIRGFETEVDFKATETTLVGVQVQYLDAKFIKFQYIQAGAPTAGTLCSSTLVTPGNFRVNCEGLRPEKSPKWTINQSLQQKVPLASGGEVTFNVNGHYQTGSYTAITFVPSDYQAPYWIGDASVGYSSPDHRWNVTAFVNNFTDKTVINNTQHQQVDSSPIRTPRTYGVRLNLSL
jgi:iron complex outermembrane receptor protein